MVDRWRQDILIHDYDACDPVLKQRCAMMQLASDNFNLPTTETSSGLQMSLKLLAKSAREAGRYEVAALFWTGYYYYH